MAGHSHWKQIKANKGATDVKRGVLFSKLLRAVSAAAKQGADPDFNYRLRATILKAKEANVPQENIDRAIKAREETTLEEILMEAYGPGGAAILITGTTNNKNRSTQEVKALLRDHGAKWAEPGSVRWAFELIQDENKFYWQPKFKQDINEEDRKKLEILASILKNHEDIEEVYTNV